MNVFEAEKLKQKIQTSLSVAASPRKKLIVLKNYYTLLLKDSPKLIIKAYINEFLDVFLNSINRYEVFYFQPHFTNEIIDLLKKIRYFQFDKDIIESIDGLIYSLTIKLKQLNRVLEGDELIYGNQKKVYFPLLEKDNQNQSFTVGTLETFTIDIKKNNNEDIFIIVPSTEIIDEQLITQIKISWQIANNYINNNVGRLNKFHKIIVHFDHRWGNYTGSSLGAALAISFIEELIKFYNFSFIISIRNNIALTGGFDENTNLKKLNESIIDKKLETIFYSYIQIFIVPEENKNYAQKKLEELKENYPKRNLQIFGITDLQDLLNRRNLIDIKRQNPVVRTTKYARKNWVVTILILIILLLSGYFYEFNFDDNPAILNRKGGTLFVENKSGRVLFTKSFLYDGSSLLTPSYIRNLQRIVDINNDGKNELLTAREQSPNLMKNNVDGTVNCYNYKGQKIWSYLFRDTISSPGERLSRNYTSYLIDTATVNNKKVLVAYSTNIESFGSAIYMLDLQTGKRVFDTFWHPGFIYGAYIIESNNRKEKELVFAGQNNSWNRRAIGILPLNNIAGKAPSDKHHDYYGNKIADLKYYALLPDVDYHQKIIPKNPTFSGQGDFMYFEKDQSFYDHIYMYPNLDGIIFIFSKDFQNISMIINDDFAKERDPYVRSGKLKPPYSDTQEYRDLLISKILWWNGKKFVKKGKLK